MSALNHTAPHNASGSKSRATGTPRDAAQAVAARTRSAIDAAVPKAMDWLRKSEFADIAYIVLWGVAALYGLAFVANVALSY